MKIAFRFENGNSTIFLTPESGRERRFIELCQGGKPRIKATIDETLAIDFVPEQGQDKDK